MSARRGLTVVELLVVIAIIAILAAILFPVFAQAKLAAKKTAALSNTKNIATASIAPAGNRAGRISLMYEAALLGYFRNLLPPAIIALEPSGQVVVGGKRVRLALVACRMRQDKVVAEVSRVRRERHEVVDLALSERTAAIEASRAEHLR